MTLTEFHQAVNDAQETMRLADLAAQRLAKLLRGRLRSSFIDDDTLIVLKRELADYNMQTRRWKEKA